ncbi:MAG: hypothetical protein ABSH50_19465 [Bryobacteraceae bacterium]|jgi:uncharacterized protein (TIGR03437 family)
MQNFKLLAGSFFTVALFLFPVLSSAQTVAIVSGNGQIVCPGCEVGTQVYAPLIVQVNSSAGTPVANTTVTWTVLSTGFNTTATTTTNSAGQASYVFTPPAFFGLTYLAATIQATALGATASFIETTFLPSTIAPTAPVFINLVPETSPPSLTGGVGQTSSTTITISVFTNYGPLPGVQVKMTSGATNQPTVGCATQVGQQAGTLLTDATGTAICTPVFGNVIGSGSYSIVVGGNYTTFGPAPLTVTAGTAAMLKIFAGNNQNVNPGVVAPLALVAEVTDIGGNPSSDAGVKWAVTEGTATLTKEVTTSNSSGQVSADVTPTIGPVQVTVTLLSNSKVSVVFTVNVNIVATGMTIVSGNTQQANETQPFADPLIVQVSDNGTPVAGATVTFAVTSAADTASLSATSATTNAQGQAQIDVTAGVVPGTITIVASVKSGSSTYTQTFDLTVNPPGPTITSINNAASYTSQFVSPCSLAVIYGSGLTPGFTGVASSLLAPQMQVANVTVQFGTANAPILYVANLNGQESVSVQVPCEITLPASGSTTVQMVVSVNNVASPPFPVTVSLFSPGIFMTTDPTGTQLPILIGAADGQLVTEANPARPGNTYRMFVTGLGQTTPQLVTGEFDPLLLQNGVWVPQPLPVQASIIVGVNNGGAPVTWAGYAYDMLGVYEVDFQVPANTATGPSINFAVVALQGNIVTYGNGTAIPIQ